jgi:outer membrane protein OmpA-like peptidoglycan-associated protein
MLSAIALAAAGARFTIAAAPLQKAAPPSVNLLSYSSGTIVRSYTKGITSVELIADGGADADGNPPGVAEGTAGPVQIVYELPGVATLSSLVVTLNAAANVGVAVSTTSAGAGFRDVGAARAAGVSQTIAGAAGAKARWIKVTAALADGKLPIQAITASGTLAARPAGAPAPAGDFFVLDQTINEEGGVRSKPADPKAKHLEVTAIGDALNALECDDAEYTLSFPGRFDGRTWSFLSTECAGACAEISAKEATGHFVINDEGTLLVGVDNKKNMRVFVRAAGRQLPLYCAPQTAGTGATNVLALANSPGDNSFPVLDADAAASARLKNYTFHLSGLGLLTPALLKNVDIVALIAACRPEFVFNAQQTAALMDWVQAGHKLLIQDSDYCGEGTRYDFLPYRFVTDNPGAKGSTGHTLLIVENDTLGTADKNDSQHYVDVSAYAAEPVNDLGDANTVVTQDAHWCGHLFGINSNGVSGFMQTYALYGKGLIVFDGLDKDDSGIPQFQALRLLEYQQPIPADLSCSHPASSGFVIAPDSERTFVPGKAQTVAVPVHALSNNGWKGHVTLSAVGDFAATVSPAVVDLPPNDAPFTVNITIPAATKAGHYAVVVKGASGNQRAQTTIAFRTEETKDTLRAALESSCQVAVYGVNFDFNKTTLRPDAEPVLQQILGLFKDDPRLSAEIGGHTDNIGTAAYNLTLSGGRAAAVKAWLIAHGVDAARLATKGYGDTVPLVPNDSDANRAKNRRVELKKAGCTQGR